MHFEFRAKILLLIRHRKSVVARHGIEPWTLALLAPRSNQLSYQAWRRNENGSKQNFLSSTSIETAVHFCLPLENVSAFQIAHQRRRHPNQFRQPIVV